jgi:DNA polymerase-1
MALVGDAADNIPGVKGIGEKTAKELLLSFGSLDELLSHPERIGRERLRKMITEHREEALLSRQLATIDTSAPLDFRMEDFRLEEPDWVSLVSLFREFEFTTLMKMIPASGPVRRERESVLSLQRLEGIISGIRSEVALDVETTGWDPLRDDLVGLSLCTARENAFYIPVAHHYPGAPEQVGRDDLADALRDVLTNEEIEKIGHNLKFDLAVLDRCGLRCRGRLLDTMIAAYLLNPNRSSHSLDEVSFEYLSKRKKTFAEVLNKRPTFADVPLEEATHYSAEDAALAYELKEVLFRKLRDNALEEVYFSIEMPLITVLLEMEEAGMKIDSSLLERMSSEMEVEIESIRKRIFFLAGEEFNVNSPKQLGKVLFHSLGLTPSKKTKTGYSTGMDVLEELAEEHELPREVLQYRSLTKLKTTYLDVLPGIVNPRTGRLHTSFNQTVTATGRLSSSDPNLQNIPVRGEWGRKIREAFVAEERNLLLSADYSQVELRILAHLSGDGGLIDAFTKGIDVHTRTASELFGVPIERVTQEMRRTAKTVNFGVLYGISPFGLSETLNIGREEARRYIEQYFSRHPGVSEYIRRVIAEAEERGYAETLLGRRRPVPELQNRNRTVRQLGERLAVNSPVQGTAADIIKLAMIRISRRLKEESLRARMILQVHDELLFELPEPEVEAVSSIVRQEMEGVVALSVPLLVEMGHGRNWAEAH